jgi:Amt family ammonium transporter
MKTFGIKRLAGLLLAAAIVGAPLAAPAVAQTTSSAPATASAAPAASSAAASTAAAAAAPAAAAPAAAATPPKIDSGDTAWMLTSSVLVLMMTIPGLALFYAGMVRKKNILATLAQSFGATALITVLWTVIGYSIAFTGSGKYVGDFKYFLLAPMGLNAVSALAPTIPESVYMFFQMTFAIITPALIAGALADRMKYSAFLLFMGAWLLFVYCPIAHWVWGGGWLGTAGALDFAGGTVVHLNAGTAGLVAALMLGKRKGLGTENFAPHNLAYSVIGASLLWVGWFGFNAGSAVTSGFQAGMAAAATQIATAAATLAWMGAEWIVAKKPSVLGMVSGAVAGLVAITPASGYVDPVGALFIGLAAGVVCYLSAVHLKKLIGYDDALDCWGVHGIGGALGAILTGVFAKNAINSAAKGWIYDHNPHQMILQFEDVGATFIYCAVVTFIILAVLKYTIGIRVSEEVEVEGLDINLHGELVHG